MNMHGLSQKVESMANLAYNELEKLIRLHGHDDYKELVLILIDFFESLDASYCNEEELLAQNKLLTENHERLLTQYEKEKATRKEIESRLFLNEETFEDQRKEYELKIQQIENASSKLRKLSERKSDEVDELLGSMSDKLKDKKFTDFNNNTMKNQYLNDYGSQEIFKRRKSAIMSSVRNSEHQSLIELNMNIEKDSFAELINDQKKLKRKNGKETEKIQVSRKEINKLLDERNHYKEELLDLRENVAEAYRALSYNSQTLENTIFKSKNNSPSNSPILNKNDFFTEKGLVSDNSLKNALDSKTTSELSEESFVFVSSNDSENFINNMPRTLNPFKIAKRYLFGGIKNETKFNKKDQDDKTISNESTWRALFSYLFVPYLVTFMAKIFSIIYLVFFTCLAIAKISFRSMSFVISIWIALIYNAVVGLSKSVNIY